MSRDFAVNSAPVNLSAHNNWLLASRFRLNLIGFVSGSNCLIWIWRRRGGRSLVVGSRHGRLRWFHIRFRDFGVRFSCLVQLVAELVLCFLKLLYRLAHSAGEFRQLLGSE